MNKAPEPEIDFDALFDRQIEKLARLLEWKQETVAGLIFNGLNLFYFRGRTPPEIAETILQYLNYYEFEKLKDRRNYSLSWLLPTK